jgi:class 3 adenylate cyclase/pimeloyl-ACP methyl ester carboxylesterase
VTAIPSVQYVQNGALSLAYQVVGQGRKDLVYLLFETPNVVGNWFIPEHARFMERLASFSRLVITDRRGMGCSDRLPPGQSPTLEELVDDLLVITEAAYARPATVLAGSESAFVALLAAATHPDRFDGLVLWAPSPSWRRSEDLPWERSDDEIESALGVIRRVTNLGSWAERFVRDALPSLAGDADAVSQVQALSALAGSAEAWYQEQRMFNAVDLRELLESIRTQTHVLSRPECAWTTPESVRYVADHLPNATLLELPGADGLPWIGQSDAVLDAIQEFMTGARHVAEPDRMLATVLFTDIVGSTEMAVAMGDRAWRTLLEQHHSAIRAALKEYRGREVDTAGDGFLATFDGPARAVECARAAIEATAALGIVIRAGCHTGEVELSGADVAGIAVHIGARIAALAGPSEILVSSTVRDLVAGSGLAFEDAGDHQLKGVPDLWHLFRVVAA